MTVEYCMARGFESKDVEFQQAEAERTHTVRQELTPEERARADRRRSLELSLLRARHDLNVATSPALMAQSIDRLTSFAASIKQAGFTDAVLLGMGGSSLAPEVLRAALGSAPGCSSTWRAAKASCPATVAVTGTS